MAAVFLLALTGCEERYGHISKQPADCQACYACRARLAEELAAGRDCESACWDRRNREYLACREQVEAWKAKCLARCGDAEVCRDSCANIAWGEVNDKCYRRQRQECFCETHNSCDCRGCPEADGGVP